MKSQIHRLAPSSLAAAISERNHSVNQVNCLSTKLSRSTHPAMKKVQMVEISSVNRRLKKERIQQESKFYQLENESDSKSCVDPATYFVIKET